jgi:hypothetical protein
LPCLLELCDGREERLKWLMLADCQQLLHSLGSNE